MMRFHLTFPSLVLFFPLILGFYLCDAEERLFDRDASYFDAERPNAKKAFLTFGLAAGVKRGGLEPRAYLAQLAKGEKGPQRVVTVAEDGAWTWYNDERAIFWRGHLFTGYVTTDGTSAVSAYALPGVSSFSHLKELLLSTWKEVDDHNNPAFLPLNEQDLLAVYARHHTAHEFNSRTIRAHGQGKFSIGPEQTIAQPGSVTYTNLFRLTREEDRIYNFFRCLNFSPTMVWSDDEGKTWSEPLQVLTWKTDQPGNRRPYVKYASDGKGRIDLFFNDGHPRIVKNNNVYHLYYENGAFHRSDGQLVRTVEELAGKGPIKTDQGTRIYDGLSEGRGWVHDFERGPDGELAGVYINSADGDAGLDLRYRYARFDPVTKSWSEREIAFAGPHLYVPENHYAGGICLDPENINIVYLSSSLDPASGDPNRTGKYQIYKGMTDDEGETWHFEQLTFDLTRDNLRPFVPRDKLDDLETAVLWFRGQYNRYIDYHCEIVGIIE